MRYFSSNHKQIINIHPPTTCRLSPIFHSANKRNAFVSERLRFAAGHCEQALKRQGDEWHKARTLAGRIPSFTTGAYLAFIAVETREFTTVDSSLLQGKLRCNGCHSRCGFRRFMDADSPWTMSATIVAVVSRFVRDTLFEFDGGITWPLEKKGY